MSRPNKKDVDPEAELRYKFKLKCRFRAIVRLAHANAYWLMDSGADQYSGDDVKKRVAQAIRKTTKKKQLLSLEDKKLLNKPAEDRTDKEKQYLYRIIGGLKCFKRYPAHVKRKLAAATYFLYFEPGRAIVRQHHEALAMYFIVTGDVVVSQSVMDELIQEFVSVEVGIMRAGDMFGEVSLLHNIPRTATCTTSSHCEFLVLMKEDFKNILLSSVQKQWDEVKCAMAAFTYFDALDDVARREGCIVAKMKTFEKNETILGDGAGVPNFVYFVLSGRCQMIEALQVFCTTRLGQTYYKLYETPKEDEESECLDFEAKYFGALKKEQSQASKSLLSQNKIEQQSQDDKLVKTESGLEMAHGASDVSGVAKCKPASITTESPSLKERSIHINDAISTEDIQGKERSLLTIIKEESEIFSSTPKYLKTYFMQVCQMNPGCSFGFGENMRHRRIIALTPVSCMLLPKIWLLQKNTANIWTRIEHFLNRKVPTTRQLFNELVRSRRWLQYREEVVQEVVARSNTSNWTTIHDVPYSIRIEEMLDI